MKRNCTRVKLKSSDVEIIVMSVDELEKFGCFEPRIYNFQPESDGSWSLTIDVMQEFHPLSKDCLSRTELFRAGIGKGCECEDFEIVVIEYLNSKKPVIRKFDDSCLEKLKMKLEGGMSDELELVANGDIEAGHRIFEHVASMDIKEEFDSKMHIHALLSCMKRSGMIPQGHLIDPLRERFAHAMEMVVESEEKSALESWFDAACLKARSMLNPASTAPRRAATI